MGLCEWLWKLCIYWEGVIATAKAIFAAAKYSVFTPVQYGVLAAIYNDSALTLTSPSAFLAAAFAKGNILVSWLALAPYQ